MRVGRSLFFVVTTAALIGLAVSSRQLIAQSGMVRLLSGSGADLRAGDQMVDRMTRSGELRRRRVDPDTLLPNREHERMDQYYNGVRVFGGDVARQTERGSTVSLFGTIYEGIDLDVTPALTIEDAAAVVKAACGVDLGPAAMPQLLVLPEDGRYRLVYRAKAFHEHGGTEYFIDAQTGTIVRERDAVQRQAAIGTGLGVLADTKKMSTTAQSGAFFTDDLKRPPLLRTYDMRGDLTRTRLFLNGFLNLTESDRATDTDNDWTDAAVVDAHAYAGFVYDYYFKRFNRHGLNNADIPIQSLVHPVRRADVFFQPNDVIGEFYVNAAYYGSGVMVYGEGLPPGVTLGGQSWNYLAGSLDVVGHELSHGVTDFSSGLNYERESGALNESFSDMMGTAIEFFHQESKADYVLGEDVITPGGIRSMANPGAFGDPDNYSKRSLSPEDNFGVHTNSGIGNQFYYLAIEGGVNRTSGLSVTGVGRANRDRIEKVVYRAFTQLLTSNATYSVARSATIQAARDLYGAGSSTEAAVTQAWTAVGVN